MTQALRALVALLVVFCAPAPAAAQLEQGGGIVYLRELTAQEQRQIEDLLRQNRLLSEGQSLQSIIRTVQASRIRESAGSTSTATTSGTSGTVASRTGSSTSSSGQQTTRPAQVTAGRRNPDSWCEWNCNSAAQVATVACAVFTRNVAARACVGMFEMARQACSLAC
jgi:hypothetical protein